MSRSGRNAARVGRHVSPPASSHPALSNDPPRLAWVLVLLAVATIYVPTLGIPFLGDDYVFLDKTRLAGFSELWSRSNTNFGWYRPWSREFYFWAVQHVAGASAIAFRTANLLLWTVSLLIFGEVVRRLSDRRTSLVTIAGVASLGLWGAPLLWISGSQDLWMFFFLSLALLCVVSGRHRLAIVPYVGALLSKETAAVFPLLAVGVWWLPQRRSMREIATHLLPLVAMTLVWLILHPILVPRLMYGRGVVSSAEQPIGAWAVASKTALSMINADQIGGAFIPTARGVVIIGVATALLAMAVWLASTGPKQSSSPENGCRLLALGGFWAVAGWLPLLLPSISWHAYYGCIGSTCAWVTLAAWLGNKRAVLVTAIVALGILRVFNTSSRAWDWGSEWYQRRAGAILSGIRTQLMARYPILPHHSRVFFGHIPNNIGLVAGSSPAVRVWYGDSTLQAGFYSYYHPRSRAEAPGPDLFFHFDSTLGIQEVRLGPEDVARVAQIDPNWEPNHEALAMTLLRSGDYTRAADEFEKIAQLPSRTDAVMFAAMCSEAAGNLSHAHQLMTAAAARTGETPSEIAAWAERLRATMPRAGG